MTDEIKVDEPRVLWFNEYEDRRLGSGYHTEDEAREASMGKQKRIVKFQEVL